MSRTLSQHHHPPHARPLASRGFTLVELMIVVAIVGILAGLGGSFLRTPRDEKALGASTAALSSLMSQARNRAMSTGRAVILRIEGHKPLHDPLAGESVGTGARSSRIQIFDSASANCADQLPQPLIDPPNGRVLDPSNPELPYRHAVISRVAPANVSGVAEVCFTPTGRVVDPGTSRPLPNIGSSVFGGRLLVEFRPVNCHGLDCNLQPDRATLSLGFNGLVEQMPSDFDLGNL